MIKDWNRGEVMHTDFFTLKGSTDRYIQVDTPRDFLFINLETCMVHPYDEIEENGLFYTKEDDEDFKGVNVIGKI